MAVCSSGRCYTGSNKVKREDVDHGYFRQDSARHRSDWAIGGAVIRHMLLKRWKLRALSRNSDGVAAQDLARQGVEVMKGDLEDAPSLERATRSVYSIYNVQDFW